MTINSATHPHTHPAEQVQINGISMSRMGLGCMGMSEFYGASDDSKSMDLLQHALQCGIRFFDTADVYGYGHNERLLGSFLQRAAARSDIVLATKGGILRDDDDPGKRGVDNSPEYIVKAIERSLSRLQTYIDLYYLHRMENDGALIEESMSALAGELAQGRIRAVGISEASATTIQRADAALRRFTDGKHGLAAVQMEYSLMTRHVETNGVDEMCRQLGILLVAYSPVCRGLLATPDFQIEKLEDNDFRRSLPRFQGANFETNRALAGFLRELARQEGLTPAQVALAWLLAKGPHVVPIPGCRTIERLEENAASLNAQLSAASIAELEARFTTDAVAGLRYTEAAMQAYGLVA